jgi:hypothetical protein
LLDKQKLLHRLKGLIITRREWLVKNPQTSIRMKINSEIYLLTSLISEIECKVHDVDKKVLAAYILTKK